MTMGLVERQLSLSKGIGIIGEYVSKIYMKTKHRPRYFIEQRV